MAYLETAEIFNVGLSWQTVLLFIIIFIFFINFFTFFLVKSKVIFVINLTKLRR